jgi:hypothetical protein
MALLHNDTEFGDSCAPTFYTPDRAQTFAERFVRGVVCLACFACIGALLAACGAAS